MYIRSLFLVSFLGILLPGWGCGDDGGGGGGDECVAEDCGPNASCTDTGCECDAGYEGDGQTCIDIDECSAGTAECSPVAACTNTEGSYECTCPDELIDYGGECVQLSLRDDHACMIRDGALSCWGSNGNGELGLGDSLLRAEPTQVGTTTDWNTVSAGYATSCGIRGDGTLWCWGNEDYSGVPDTADRTVPNQIGSDTDWAQVSAGEGHHCAVKTDGTAWCWGAGDYQQLGNGDDTGEYFTPQAVGTDTDWVQIVAGYEYSCALKADGRVFCWGADYYGQLGNGDDSSDEAPNPVEVPGLTGVVRIDGGVSSSGTICAVADGGSVSCWGDNNSGELGAGTEEQATSPVALGNPFTRVAVGRTTCAIDPDSDLWCWGLNRAGSRGVGIRDEVTSAAQEVDATRDWLSVSVGYDHACGLADDGSGTARAFCWGSNTSGSLGLGFASSASVPTQVAGAWSFVDTSPSYLTCGIKTDGTLWCWGVNDRSGQAPLILGKDLEYEQEPIQIGSDADWIAVSTGLDHGCGIRTVGTPGRGELYCWGDNDQAQLGLGNTDPQTGIQQVGANTDWTKVSVGGNGSTCGMRGEDNIYCWGANNNGEVGFNDGAVVTAPTYIGNQIGPVLGESVNDVSIGNGHACASATVETSATTSEDRLYCWGRNNSIQLGNDDTVPGDDQTSPQEIDTGHLWRVAPGDNHSCAVRATDDTLHCWGSNSSGQLGLDDQNRRTTPTLTDDTLAWDTAAAAATHTCAITTAGALYCFGEGGVQLGMNLTPRADNVLVPTQVGTANNWTQVVGGSRYSCALNAASELYCWGQNGLGQLGIGTRFRTTPTAVIEP